jgi:hypothetical protein
LGELSYLLLPPSSRPQLTASLGESSYLLLPPSSRPSQLATSIWLLVILVSLLRLNSCVNL